MRDESACGKKLELGKKAGSDTQGKQGDETFHALMVALGDGYHSADELANSLALDVIEVHQALVQLEIDGQLTRSGHGHWTRIRA